MTRGWLKIPVAALVVGAAGWALVLDDDDEATAAGATETLKMVAARTTTGWIDDRGSQDELERRVESGERVYITCGTAALLAQRMLAELGVESRLITTLTRRPFNGVDDGHTMLEVRDGDSWVLYDLVNNRRAVDAAGRPVDALTQIRAGSDRRWSMIAGDKLVELRGATPLVRRVTEDLFLREGIEAWYDRVLGTLLIEDDGRYVFHDRNRGRVESYSPAFTWVDAATWQRKLEDSS